MCFHAEIETIKKVYLLFYNGVQWAGFILIVISLLKSLLKGKGKINDSSSFVKSILFHRSQRALRLPTQPPAPC